MSDNSFLLYGANGYTGELIVRYAHLYNLVPILAGRREAVLQPLAQSLQLKYKVIDLDDRETLESALREVKLVIHAAGPFAATARQMVEACIATGTHYLDINGDISVFEMIRQYDAQARQADVMLMPGVGFDVVPTDCLAARVKKMLPEAIALKLAFATLGGGLSHGTASTMAGKLGEGGAARKNGKIVRVPLGQKSSVINFPTGPGTTKPIFVMSIPWGDISTAFTSTGIPDIETYTNIPKKVYYFMKLQPLFNWLLRTGFMRRYIKKKIDQRPAGPTDAQREKAIGYVWAQATDAAGKTAIAAISCPEGYTLTLHSSLLIAQKVLNGQFMAGYQTPSLVYGENLVLEIPGVQLQQG